MSESPTHFDPEKDAHVSNEKNAVYSKDAIVYADEATGETEAVEFGEVKELRVASNDAHGRRGLAQRHIQMIALAGTIGTGLFLGSGKAIALGGPLGGVVLSIAELSALVPLSGGIIRHAEYFVDPALSFANGWNHVYNTMVSLPAELVAAAVIVEFWSSINPAIWITVFGVLLVASNLFLVRIYGELEFTFASLKIMLIIGLNIMALVITCGGGPDHHRYGFQYWRNPGPFTNYLGYTGALGNFMGFYTTFSNAVYAYSGVEGISIAAAETQAPRRNIPMAAKRIFWRVLIFYVLSIFMVGLIVPSNDPDLLNSTGTAASSPFVLAASRAGIKVVPSIINAVVLTSAWSSGNSAHPNMLNRIDTQQGLLGGSRTLYGMAREGHAPKIFLRINRFGIPYVAICSLSLFICLGYMTLSDSASIVFGWLQDLVSVAALVNWIVICIVYLRFYYGMKKQGISRSDLPWKAPFQPYVAWIALTAFTILLFFGGYTVFIHGDWDTELFVSSYINIPIILLLYFGYKFWKKTKIIPLSDIPIQRFIDIANANPEPPRIKPTGLRRLNILWS
ncbi:Proline-specific permease [Hyphodiscus hymeniophilus]|uniref:Proline-specific permease n=1 Tax=Hyphodiscus hymeniophilus TaxID=353542 RepID=A0A9P6VPV4_9HELO|nr:Proline-specific permease [Hyphodiscus hymeniophilus]